MGESQEHVLGDDGQFHVEDEKVDLGAYGWEDWVCLALFVAMAAVLFYQVFTRYVMDDSAGWTEEIARYVLVAVVFENIEDFHKRIDDPKLDIDADCVMVLKNCGPKGYPGMAEVGNMPLPPKLLKRGVTDMLRISDARMSGTAYGSVVLHMSPEAAAGGLLALVQNGDIVEMDVSKGKLELLVSEKEIARRRKNWKKPKPQLSRGYWRLYFDHVNQAHEGADLDFLVGGSGDFVPRDNH